MAHNNEDVAYVHIEPFIPDSKSIPEVTTRVIVLGIFLAIVLAASSTYLGLKIARTISASIPAALISMLVLRRLKTSNILENNMVQTIASAGEVVASGVIFTLPALVIIGHWTHINYFQTALVTIIGGILGVMFSVPLRQSLVVGENLPYPEGLATAEILRSGENTKGSAKVLIKGSIFAAIFAFLQSGFKVVGEQVSYWTKIGTAATGLSIVLSPVMMAAGYIVGMRGLIAFFVGGLITWGIGIPYYVSQFGLPEAANLGAALSLVQKEHFRYIAIGVMAIGGIWCVISLMGHIKKAITSSFKAMHAKKGVFGSTPRTERDLPFNYVLWTIAALLVPTFLLFLSLVDKANFSLSSPSFWSFVIFATVAALVVGFVAAAVAAYIVGIVGSTSLPVSSISLSAVIAFSLILLGIVGHQIDFRINTPAALEIAAIVVIFACIICVAAAVSGDNMQDLKAGHLVGATPWKQQLMLMIGAIASALVIPFILQTTFEAYGIGNVLPRPNMDPSQALAAPQATLMATVAKGIFVGNLPWTEIYIGVGVGIVAILIDEFLRRQHHGYRFQPLVLALGIYFPLSYVACFFVGAVINSLVAHASKRKSIMEGENNGILFASGIIAGEAILGAILTIPFAYFQSTDIMALNLPWLAPYYNLLGVVLFLGLCVLLYRQALMRKGSTH